MSEASASNFWRGERIQLRALEPDDVDILLAEELDSASEQAEDVVSVPQSRAQARAQLEALVTHDQSDERCFLAVVTHAGELAGLINTFDCDARTGCFKYALTIRRSFRRHGYAREAILILLRHYFGERRYQKCTVVIYDFNLPSIYLHQHLGFTFEGRLRRMVFTQGRYYDELYFGITAEEFATGNPLPLLPQAPAGTVWHRTPDLLSPVQPAMQSERSAPKTETEVPPIGA